MAPQIEGRELLDDHALARTRLVGALTQDVRWRERRDRGTTRRLVGGTVIALLACTALAAGTFVSTQLATQRRTAQLREQQQQAPPVTVSAVPGATPAVTAPAVTAPARPLPVTRAPVTRAPASTGP